MNSPKLVIRFLPVPRVDWLGNVTIQCKETGLEAELCYRGNSFLSRRSQHRSIKGKIFLSSSSQTIYEINGHWDRTVTIKDASNERVTIIYNANEALSGLKTPIVKDPKDIVPSESIIDMGRGEPSYTTEELGESEGSKEHLLRKGKERLQKK
ncbi:Oxysterol-binding protein-related protein 4C [Forsythia ovata]|uniref:Oxysterol-binding protein-related protein 4C n=1 Tax=Forsythia ovata TaxID=205694 RepID=A0ABD1WWR9_9LAMI